MDKVKHKGDKGATDLLFGGRIKKSSLTVEAVGELDELGSFIGLAKTAVTSRATKRILGAIQRDLYIISSEIITPATKRRKLELRFEKERIAWLEKLCAPKKKWGGCCFFIPGENRVSATFDVCRTVCRRAERTLWKLHGRKKISPHILTYVNRLSTFLFIQARDSERRHKTFR
jgi:ATP:cob(I)alamin adenosyltransferase